MAWSPRRIVFLVALLAGDARADPNARFDAAIALEGGGSIDAAVDALESLARDLPTDPLAPDALAEAAGLCEARLFDPARALKNWSQIVASYPHSRVVRRATARKAELERVLAGSAPALVGAFERLIGQAGDPPSAASRAAVAKFLDEHPGFSLADRGAYFLARAAEQANELDEAERRYQQATHGDWAARATRAKADLELHRGRLDAAASAYAALAQSSDPVSRAAQAEGLVAVRAARLERALTRAAIVLLLLFVATHLRGAKLLPVPIEILYLAPVAIFFVLATLSQARSITPAIAEIGVGAMLVTWLTVAMSRTPRSLARRALNALSAVLAIASILYLVVVTNELGALVLETLRTGPDQ